MPSDPPSSAQDKETIYALQKACRSEIESCFTLGAALLIWQRQLIAARFVLLLGTVIFGGMAILQILLRLGGAWVDVLGGLLILATVLLLGAYVTLGALRDPSELGDAAAQFFSLRDRFRYAAELGPTRPLDKFWAQFDALMSEKGVARQSAPIPPASCIRAVRSGNTRFLDDGTGKAGSETPPSQTQGQQQASRPASVAEQIAPAATPAPAP